MSEFIDQAKKNNGIKKYSEVYDKDVDLLEEEKLNFYIGEQLTSYQKYKIGDIVFVKKSNYDNNKEGFNHLFVIIDEDNYAVEINYFCMLISSNLQKLKYKSNILLTKNLDNNLKYDSIVKTDKIYEISNDDIIFMVGKVPLKLVEKYKNTYLKYRSKIYE